MKRMFGRAGTNQGYRAVTSGAIAAFALFATAVQAEAPALGSSESRITQQEIEAGMPLIDVRTAGLKVFSTPFNLLDGFGDGPMDPENPGDFGGRPTLQGNGTFLRVNGLDAQTCLECHGIVSMDTIPFTPGVGGAAGISSSPMFSPSIIDVDDSAAQGMAGFNGRLINPPALFGTGGVQLAAQEMTVHLQDLRQVAIDNPGTVIQLDTKGVHFGSITANAQGEVDTSNIEGIDDDLVVRPFGRKGEFATVRQFGVGAMMFHHGMQPVEVVGVDVDDDNDGVLNEIGIGEVSALEIFLTTQERPVELSRSKSANRGFKRFIEFGCSGCHKPQMQTLRPNLKFAFPVIDTDPDANTFYTVNLRNPPARLPRSRWGGIRTRMFSDLKRHDMGEALSESFADADAVQNREFITAKLWGVADTSPYMHDGRALTLESAIDMHGGEAQQARDAFASTGKSKQRDLVNFLKTLRNPSSPNSDVLE